MNVKFILIPTYISFCFKYAFLKTGNHSLLLLYTEQVNPIVIMIHPQLHGEVCICVAILDGLLYKYLMIVIDSFHFVWLLAACAMCTCFSMGFMWLNDSKKNRKEKDWKANRDRQCAHKYFIQLNTKNMN